MELDTQWALQWILTSAKVISANREELNELDRLIGDGDHGENLDRGFQAVSQKLSVLAPDTMAEVFKTVATTLMSTVGGAAGPLYGTAFLRAAKAAESSSMGATELARALTAAAEGIAARGRAQVGDKTMVDAWLPAAHVATEVARQGGSAVAALVAAGDAARSGAQATEPLIARRGRASYLGERAIGHRDPGAQSSSLIFKAAGDVAKEMEED